MIKTTKIKRKINSFIIDIIFKNKKRTNKNTSKILVIATDALGDVIVKSKLYDIIVDKYGEKNVSFIFNDKWSKTMEKLGYKIFHKKTKKEKYGLIKRINLIKKINKEHFEKIINLEVVFPDISVDYFNSKEKIGFVRKNDINNFDKYLYIDEYQSIRNQLKDMGELILNKKLNLNDIDPKLKDKVLKEEERDNIIISIGASNKKRICSLRQMLKIIKYLKVEFPEKKIILLGVGEEQKNYSKQIEKKYDVENKVDKLSIFEVIREIKKCKVFIGFDSGLYNIAYALEKKSIGIFNHYSGFEHNIKNIQIIMCEENKKLQNKNIIFVDKIKVEEKNENYGTLKLNNFGVKYVKQALKNLNLIGRKNEKKDNIS